MRCWGIPRVPAARNAGPTSDRGKLMRVLVVDDHDLFRAGLARLLALQPGMEVVAQASSGRMGVRLAEELHPDVVLMDLRMPDLDGSEATRAILDSQPSARVVALSVSVEEVDVAAAMQAGACGFLVKDAPIDEVVVAVRAAAQGATWLSSRAAEVVLRGLRRAAPEPDVGLVSVKQISPRELEVLRLIARGMENAEIGETLSISPRTAKNHVSSILAKLRLPGRVQAATYAVRHGLD
jgi:DNA-binding NarL/FixJ family response regulator